MSKLLIVHDKTEISFWIRLGQRLFKSREFASNDSSSMMSFINNEMPEVIYFELGQDIEANDFNEFLEKVMYLPISLLILEAATLKISIFSMLFPMNFLERIFPPRKIVSA